MILGDDSKIYSKQSLKLLQLTFLPLPLELLDSYRFCSRKNSFGLLSEHLYFYILCAFGCMHIIPISCSANKSSFSTFFFFNSAPYSS